MRNNTHAHNIFPGERNLLKNPILANINLMNRDVLQLLFSTEHNLQVNNLYLYSLISSDLDLFYFCLCLSPYFLAQFLEKLGPYYLIISPKWVAQFPRLIIWLHATPVRLRLVLNWCYTTLESPPQLGNSISLHALSSLGWLIS